MVRLTVSRTNAGQNMPIKSYLSIRIPPEILAEIDKLAEEQNRTRTGQTIHLLRDALARTKKGKK